MFSFFSQLSRGNKTLFIIILLSFVTSLGSLKIFERNETGEILVIQYPNGSVSVFTTPGIKPQLFGKTTRYKKENDYIFEENIRFSDKGKAVISGSFRYRLPSDPKSIERLHAAYPSEDALHNSLIGRTVERALTTTGPLMTSDESAAAKRNELLLFIEDQASNGTYATERVSEDRIDPLSGKEVTITFNRVSIDSLTNLPRRVTESATQEFGIQLYKLSIADPDYDGVIDDLLAVQTKAQMAVQTAIADAAAAEQDAIKADADGRRDVAVTRAKQAVLTANAIEEAKRDSVQAQIALTTARINADKAIQVARGEAAATKAKVAAGLTPLERAKLSNERAIGMVEAWAKRPQPLMGGGGPNGKGDPMDLLIVEMIKKEITKQ